MRRLRLNWKKLGKDRTIPSSVLEDLHSRFEEGGLGISPLWLEF